MAHTTKDDTDLYATERQLHSSGYISVAGIDEVGYGSIAGPITVAACILDDTVPIEGLKDSKRFSSHKLRSQVADEIRAVSLAFAVAHRPHTLIDRIGIVGALQEAQKEAVAKLERVSDKILIDGTPFKTLLGLNEEYIVKGDATVACIAAASILAKVARDELMIDLAQDHPEYAPYDLAQNKGYGTAAHRSAIT
ncbi:MAG: ribonuclease HII, partial [Actinomycetia bacterium]|nr:ribonuclease HII [Actinomycetes bacterium]